MTQLRAPDRQRGFTLIELMSVVAVAGLLVALAAPSFTRMIEMQRLRGVQNQLVADMQFARSEAVSRNTVLRVDFRNTAALSCYSLYTAPAVQGADGPCDCRRGAGKACQGLAGRTEIRTIQIPAGRAVTVKPLEPPDQDITSFAFDPTTGGLLSNPDLAIPATIADFRVDVFLDNERRLRTWIDSSGRTRVCAPATSTMPEAACPVLPQL